MERSNPTFTLYVGPMFAGKTSRLFEAVEKCKFKKLKIVSFKPSIDDRYGLDVIVSHTGHSTPATPVASKVGILEHLESLDYEPDVVAVDEAFMIPGVAEVLEWLYRNGISIIVSTLEHSSTGKPFPEVTKLLPWATHIEKLTAVCTVCGDDARYTHKKFDGDQDDVHVGGSDTYEPRCFYHHTKVNLRR